MHGSTGNSNLGYRLMRFSISLLKISFLNHRFYILSKYHLDVIFTRQTKLVYLSMICFHFQVEPPFGAPGMFRLQLPSFQRSASKAGHLAEQSFGRCSFSHCCFGRSYPCCSWPARVLIAAETPVQQAEA